MKIKASICLELQEWLKREETLWKEKARTKWHTLIELNTRFFHLSTVIKRRRNSIDFIKNDEGHWIFGRYNIGRCFEQFYRSLFSSSHPSIPNDLDDIISPYLSDEDREMLVPIPSLEETREVLFSMVLTKLQVLMECRRSSTKFIGT